MRLTVNVDGGVEKKIIDSISFFESRFPFVSNPLVLLDLSERRASPSGGAQHRSCGRSLAELSLPHTCKAEGSVCVIQFLPPRMSASGCEQRRAKVERGRSPTFFFCASLLSRIYDAPRLVGFHTLQVIIQVDLQRGGKPIVFSGDILAATLAGLTKR
jgi:hypothetical protein